MMDEYAIDFMQEAVKLARKGEGHTRPNPPVGAIIVKDGKIIGRGWHQKCGGEHAEVAAIKDAVRKVKSKSEKVKSKSEKVKSKSEEVGSAELPLSGCTMYVTLEPCSTAGRVGACTDAIIEAGIAKVVYGMMDVNPKNAGKAKRVLRKAGVKCMELPDVVPYAMMRPFETFMQKRRPMVTVKIAMSLDGKICDKNGDARWVSSESARKMTGEMREGVDAVMVGAETIRKDNPSLLCHTKRNDDLYRVVISRSGKLPKNAQVFTDEAKDRTLVYRDVRSAMRDMKKRGFLHVLCEGGMQLAVSLAEAGFVDEWITVLASKVIGNKPIAKATKIDDAVCFRD